MGHMKIVVDHDKIEYSGPFKATDLFRMINNFTFERGFDQRQDKDFEITTANGKNLEWQISPWKKITDYIRYIIKVRVLVYDMAKVDVMVDKKKVKYDKGRVVITIDGFVEYDYDNYWDDKPFFFFVRTLFDYFVHKPYSERFEQVLTNDLNTLHTWIEKFFNMHGHHTIVSRVPV